MGTQRLDVLHVTQPTSEGVAKVVLQLARDQVESSLIVGVASPIHTTFQQSLETIPCRWYRWDSTRSPVRGLIAESLQLKSILKETAPRIVHLHSSKAGLIGRLVIRGRRPTVFEPNGWSFCVGPPWMRKLSYHYERFAANHWTDRVICVSAAELELMHNFRDQKLGTLIHNGIDLRQWDQPPNLSRKAAREQLGVPTNIKMVLGLGRVLKQKGADLMVDMWPRIRDATANAVLYWVGEGPDRESLQKSVEGDPSVRFAGPTITPKTWFEAADLVVMPSRWEGHSLSLLEAMASYRPVVAFDVEGMRESIGDDSGIVVAAGDQVAFVTAVIDLLSLSEEDRYAQGVRGRAKVETLFSFTDGCEKVRALYKNLSS